MSRFMTPTRHQQAEDARHWKQRLADEEEREMLRDEEEQNRIEEGP